MPVVAVAGSATHLEQETSDVRRWAEELLADTLAQLPGTTAGHVLHGRPSVELAKVADQYDLLIVGSRSWGPIRRVALGSTSDWLVHHAPCPVLVVPRPDDAADQAPVASATAAITD